jgi:hypothetical protein
MTLRKDAPRAKTRWLTLAATVATLTLVMGAVAFAAKPIPQVSFVDYAQCVDGTTSDAATDCPGGWINGILQASNSTYHEDEVTPQRAEILVPAGAALGNHSVTFTYQARKGSAGVHAYDSLATWNYTQKTADKDQGLNAADVVGGSAKTALIPADHTVIAPFTAPATGDTSTHELGDADRLMTAYGLGASGTLSVTTPVHDCTAANVCGNASIDDFASITVNYSVTAVPAKVQFLFGGHLGASAGARGWGAGLGASNISGGPYHIKWTAADGASIGNRDNQIMGSAILNNPTTITTSVSPTSPIIGDTLQDSATITPSTATGTVTFHLFAPSDATCSGTPIYSEGPITVVSGAAATSIGYVSNAVGIWHWTADYSGDLATGGTDQPSSSTCASEPTTVGPATPTLTTSASGPVTVGQTITDTAHLSGGYGTIIGSISFQVFAPSDTGCATPLTPQPTGDNVSQTAPGSQDYTSGTFTTTEVGTYHWEATFTDTDGNNNSVGPTTCGESGESSVVNPASPTFTTAMKLLPNDSATISGIVAGGAVSGAKAQSIVFQLFNNADCSGGSPIYSQTVTGVTADGTYPTTNTATFVTADGTYSWLVSYTGDTRNAPNNPVCTTEQFKVDFTPLAP